MNVQQSSMQGLQSVEESVPNFASVVGGFGREEGRSIAVRAGILARFEEPNEGSWDEDKEAGDTDGENDNDDDDDSDTDEEWGDDEQG